MVKNQQLLKCSCSEVLFIYYWKKKLSYIFAFVSSDRELIWSEFSRKYEKITNSLIRNFILCMFKDVSSTEKSPHTQLYFFAFHHNIEICFILQYLIERLKKVSRLLERFPSLDKDQNLCFV